MKRKIRLCARESCKALQINNFLAPLVYEHGGIRTPDPQNRNLMLYPLSYMPTVVILAVDCSTMKLQQQPV